MMKFNLTESQKRLWFEWIANHSSVSYNINVGFKLSGTLDLARLKNAIKNVLLEYGILNIRISDCDSVPFQYVEFNENDLNLFYLDYSPNEFGSIDIQSIFREYSRPFNYDGSGLHRQLIVKQSDNIHYLVLTFHHILVDAISVRKLLEKIEVEYINVSREVGLNIDAIYKSIEYSQMEDVSSQEIDNNIKHWRAELSGFNPYIKLLEQSNNVERFRGRRTFFKLDKEFTSKIINLSKETKSTLFITISAIFNILLYRFSKQTDISLGYAYSTRNKLQQDLLGFFINMLPMRIQHLPDECFVDVVEKIKANRKHNKNHQNISGVKLLKELRKESDVKNLFNVIINQSLSFSKNLSLPGIESEHIHFTDIDPQYDLSLCFDLVDGELLFEFEYNFEKYEPIFIEELKRSFKTLINSVFVSKDKPLDSLPLVETQREIELLNLSKGKVKNLDSTFFTFKQIEYQATINPDNVAIHYQKKEVSYRELDRRANVLANLIYQKLLNFQNRNNFIGLCLERSIELVISIYGIHKSGNAYLALDPQYPKDRLAYMLQQSQSEVVVTERKFREYFADFSGQLIFIDDVDWEVTSEKLTVNTIWDDPAYVIYTSGSTGLPKGVTITHRSLTNRIDWMQDEYILEKKDRVLQKTPYSFDVSVWEFFWPLMNGASIVIVPPQKHKDPQFMCEYIDEYNVTVMHFVPSMLQMFLEFHKKNTNQALRYVFCSGEAITYQLIEKFLEHFPHTGLFNLYGPTEATIDVTAWDCRSSSFSITPPIGKAIQNMQCLVLDSNGQIAPIGLSGELHLSGIGLASCYLNNEELTKKTFISNSYGKDYPNYSIMYKTGDIARYLPEGEIEYLGRRDEQIKLRGLRIELQEINHAIETEEGVRAAITIVKENKLIVFIQPSSNRQLVTHLDNNYFRNHLKTMLPQYMIPHDFIFIDEIPLSGSGKVDKKRLSEYYALRDCDNNSLSHNTYSFTKEIPSFSGIKGELVKIWSEVLKIAEGKIDINKSFYELGGDSLTMLQVIAKCNKRNIRLDLKTFIDNPYIDKLYSLVNNTETIRNKTSSEKDSREGSVLLSPIQQWFFENINHDQFIMYCSFYVRSDYSFSNLKKSLIELVKKHDSLRLRFQEKRGYWHQNYFAYTDDKNFFELEDLTTDKNFTINACIDRVSQRVNISKGPMLYCYLIESDKSPVLFLACHHLVTDAVSWKIIINDLCHFYSLNQNDK